MLFKFNKGGAIRSWNLGFNRVQLHGLSGDHSLTDIAGDFFAGIFIPHHGQVQNRRYIYVLLEILI